MNKEHCEEIRAALGVKPYHLNPVQAAPMQQPRLCWTWLFASTVACKFSKANGDCMATVSFAALQRPDLVMV